MEEELIDIKKNIGVKGENATKKMISFYESRINNSIKNFTGLFYEFSFIEENNLKKYVLKPFLLKIEKRSNKYYYKINSENKSKKEVIKKIAELLVVREDLINPDNLIKLLKIDKYIKPRNQILDVYIDSYALIIFYEDFNKKFKEFKLRNSLRGF